AMKKPGARGKGQGASGGRERSLPVARPSPLTPRRSLGFTMIEMVTSCAILSIIMVALGSVLMLSSRALDSSNNGATAQTIQARAIVDQMSGDLKMATGFSERTSSAVTF